ncbi:hypothetical protein BpHYR1_031439 [Brachionus plicatilis]|uniref:Uncharacterized protein n=1 Tax=Brachionus plicatilis TaxID=10195 RepID=A0A3M7QBD0_BRAPC|nr:hypothetical protein BpHYR1_031439 [Brachionus plicatilis]
MVKQLCLIRKYVSAKTLQIKKIKINEIKEKIYRYLVNKKDKKLNKLKKSNRIQIFKYLMIQEKKKK